MKLRYSKPIVAAVFATALAACGGASQDAGEAVGEGAAEVADAATDAVDDAGEVIADAADSATEGADALIEGVSEGWTGLQANWQDSVASIQAKWGELSADDLLSTGGDREQFVALIQEKYSLGADEAEQQVSEWEDTL